MNLAPYIGVPYAGERFCATLVARVLAGQGIPWPGVDDPAQAPAWQRVDRPQPLDVVVFTRAGRPAHVGLCVGRGRFLHVEEGASSEVARLDSRLWARRLEGVYRYTGVRACT